MADIRVPTLGESVTEATVGKWFKQPGDAVAVDEPLVELETDKVTLEVPAPAAGVLSDIAAKNGDTVAVGALLGQIKDGAARRARQSRAARRQAARGAETGDRHLRLRLPKCRCRRRCAKWRRKAASMPAKVAGSGMHGQVTKGDMMAAIERAAAQPTPVATAAVQMRAPSPADDAAREERVHMTRLRQTIARRLKDAQNTAAMLTTFNEVDMSAVMGLRNQYKELFEKKHGVKLGFMGFFVRACIQALKEIPAVNAEIDGTDIVYKNYYHIGVAVGTEKGLVVPVVRDADQMSLAAIEKAISDFGKRARDGALKIEEMQGGTFTITNGGVYGSLMSTPILNAPQSGILGMHKIQERPVVRRRQDRGAADDVSRALLRSPHRRRPRGGHLPGAGEGKPLEDPARLSASVLAICAGCRMAYDLIVIGTGPGGYVCAIRAAQLGLKTAVVEKRATFGGTCLNVGCIPSKALLHASELFEEAGHTFGKMGIGVSAPKLDLPAMMAFKDQGVDGNVKGVEFLLKKNKVDTFHGAGRIAAPGKVEVTGSRRQDANAGNQIHRHRHRLRRRAAARASRSTKSASCRRPARWRSTRCRSICWWSAPA